MFLNTAIIMTSIWLGFGLHAGVWVSSFLLCILIYTFQFALLYSVSAVIAVMTRSSIVSILCALLVWGFMIGFGWLHYGYIERERDKADDSYTHHPAFIAFDVAHTVLPRYEDVEWLTNKMISAELAKPELPAKPDPNDQRAVDRYESQLKDNRAAYDKRLEALDKQYKGYDWTSALLVSSLFMAFMLGIACTWFSLKDF
jgi:hypothetical protein